MARPRQFDKNEVLEKAMLCFWQNGYEGSSLKNLEEATGIGRISLYNTFQDKEHLFIAAQNMYYQSSNDFMSQFYNENATLDDLVKFIQNVISKDPDEAPAKFGCLMVNTALDTKTISDQIAENVKNYRQMIIGHYKSLLGRLQKNGEIRSDINIDSAAEFIIGSFWGAMSISRLYKDRSVAKLQLDMVIETIKGWST
ncbi:TetR/AcrR family transcriptional regulator [Candidatus Uabimicrobium sp. HlEnr_7]|uniref:TetR/AcrR family transcriptional regulator n=1 Tax=Candidatus Uabimicrobium helgolandensis TaxID=3095367 RepID=UPI003558F0DF